MLLRKWDRAVKSVVTEEVQTAVETQVPGAGLGFGLPTPYLGKSPSHFPAQVVLRMLWELSLHAVLINT